MPDITPAQWKVTIGMLSAAIYAIFGADITDTQQTVIVSALVGVWTLASLLSDALIRHGRATGVGPILAMGGADDDILEDEIPEDDNVDVTVADVPETSAP